MSCLKIYVSKGWPQNKNKISGLVPQYWKHKDEITIRYKLLWMNVRVMIPKILRRNILYNLHTCHLGYKKCLLRAKELYYWPEPKNQLRNLINNYQTCLRYRKNNTKQPLRSHEIPNDSWLKVGVYLYYFNKTNYLLVIDYYSKFIEVES